MDWGAPFSPDYAAEAVLDVYISDDETASPGSLVTITRTTVVVYALSHIPRTYIHLTLFLSPYLSHSLLSRTHTHYTHTRTHTRGGNFETIKSEVYRLLVSTFDEQLLALRPVPL